jgi:glutathione S-transferase
MSGGAMLELYHHGSSVCAAKVRFALAEKRLDWTGHYVDILAGAQFEPAFLAVNPKAVVPVLIHDRHVIPESTVICEYVEEAFPEHPVYPRGAYDRARVRLWTKAVDEELHPACSALTYIVSHRHTILRQGAGSFEQFLERPSSEGAAARARKWHWIQQGFNAPGAAEMIRRYHGYLLKMEEALSAGPWLVGDSLSMADIAMAPYVNRLAVLAMDEIWSDGRLPRVARWFAAIRSRPTYVRAVSDWMPAELAREMRENGLASRSELASILELA